MNRFDKDIFKVLNHFTNDVLLKVKKILKNNSQKYKRIVPKHIETHIFENKYFNRDSRLKMGITPLGLELFGTLE